MEKKISIIGGAGFIGTNLADILVELGQPFEIIDIVPSAKYPECWKEGDVRDCDSLRKAITGEIVVHLAAVHRDDLVDESQYYRTNVMGTENLTAVCNEKKIERIIFTSTVAVYGFAPPGTDESGVIAPFNEYGHTKYQAEQVLQKWREHGAKSLIIIRPTVVFGEGNRGNVFNLLNQISMNRFVMIGPGENRKSMAYVKNVANFIYECAKSDHQFSLFNYTDDPDMTMNDLVITVRKKLFNKKNMGLRLPLWLGFIIGYLFDLIALMTRKRLPVSSIRIKKFTSWSQFSSAKGTLNNFVPPYSLKQGLEQTLDYEFKCKNDVDRQVFFTE